MWKHFKWHICAITQTPHFDFLPSHKTVFISEHHDRAKGSCRELTRISVQYSEKSAHFTWRIVKKSPTIAVYLWKNKCLKILFLLYKIMIYHWLLKSEHSAASCISYSRYFISAHNWKCPIWNLDTWFIVETIWKFAIRTLQRSFATDFIWVLIELIWLSWLALDRQ